MKIFLKLLKSLKTGSSLGLIKQPKVLFGLFTLPAFYSLYSTYINDRDIKPENHEPFSPKKQAYEIINGLFIKLNEQSPKIALLENLLQFYLSELQYGKEHPNTVQYLERLAKSYNVLGKHKKAQEFLEEALPGIEKHFGQNHLKTAVVRFHLAFTYQQLRKFAKAKALYEQALPVYEFFGTKSLLTAGLLKNLAIVQCELNEIEESIERFEAALPIFEEQYGINNIKTAELCICLTKAYMKKKQIAKTLPLYEKIWPAYEIYYGKIHFKTIQILQTSAWIALKTDQLEKARGFYEHLLPILEEKHGSQSIHAAEVHANLLSTYCYDPTSKEAWQHYQKALSGYQKNYGPEDSSTKSLIESWNALKRYRLPEIQESNEKNQKNSNRC